MIADLRKARADGENEQFQRVAHSFKTNANTFGAIKLAALARAFELNGLNTDPLHDETALAELETAHEIAATALKALSHG